MKWDIPHKIKVLEAVGAIGDERIEINMEEVKVYSSSGGKFYSVKYDKENNTIYSNDNGSFWKGYLGYPAIAYLMKIGELSSDAKFASLLKDIRWKDINQKFKNDFEKTEELVMGVVEERGGNKEELQGFVSKLLAEIEWLGLNKPPKLEKPPEGY